MSTWKSILKPEGSVMAGIATMGAVYGVYQLNLGSTASVTATDPNHPVLENSRKKAGYSALVMVAGLTLLTKDANIGILGGLTIIGMEFMYRHSIMANPSSLSIENPSPASYTPAENVIPIYEQGETA